MRISVAIHANGPLFLVKLNLFILFTSLGSISLIVVSIFLLLGLLKLNSVTKALDDYVIIKNYPLLKTSSVLLVIATFCMCFFKDRLKEH